MPVATRAIRVLVRLTDVIVRRPSGEPALDAPEFRAEFDDQIDLALVARPEEAGLKDAVRMLQRRQA